MSKFPLYDSLYKDAEETDLTASQKKSFITKVQTIDSDGYELLYALIRFYQVEVDGVNTKFDIPYSGKYVNKNDIEFDLTALPNKLKRILYKFIQVHIKKLDEDKKNRF
jgi:hypothetical protein